MNFAEALKINRAAGLLSNRKYSVAFVPGCSMLSLATFLSAHLAVNKNDYSYEIIETPYGDILDSLKFAYQKETNAIAFILDFASLDSRLGLRRAASWDDVAIKDIIENVNLRLQLILGIISNSENRRTVIHPPTLDLPPIAATGSWQLSKLESHLNLAIANFCAAALELTGVTLVRAQPNVVNASRDIDREFIADFPYSQSTASQICGGLAKAIVPPSSIKGIITDLDDTLWRGLVGEVGFENVHWTLDGKSQIHAVYQQLLAACASRGILIAVASKNDRRVVDLALAREDILIGSDSIFPVIANWEQKSTSVGQIAKIWNISPQDIVFIDDNQYELDEVTRAFPEIRTLKFSPEDAVESYKIMKQLRDFCHKETSSAEDKLRLSTIRASSLLRDDAAKAPSIDEFLAGLGAKITFELVKDDKNARPFELVNKTNQFNLNGRRYTEKDWNKAIHQSDSNVISVSYTDKFGDLGRIGVLIVRNVGKSLFVDQWVLSCRAFSRRVEYSAMKFLCDSFQPENMYFDYLQTARNEPVREFLISFVDLESKIAGCDDILSALPSIYSQTISSKFNI